MSLAAHYWSIAPSLRQRLWPSREPPWQPWETSLDDPKVGTVRLTGRLTAVPGQPLVVVVHGLGGTVDRHYSVRCARAAHARGWACLRLSLRGADRQGRDFYHAGLTADVDAALAEPSLKKFSRIVIVGYSLGGHLALRTVAPRTAAGNDPRIAAVAAVCPPLDLAPAAQHLDERAPGVYRRHVMAGLHEIYRSVADRREVDLPVEIADQIESIREWDHRVVAPRFGFSGAAQYYESQSVGPHLRQLTCPALIVAAKADPMVPWATLAPYQQNPVESVRLVATLRGGHVGFPANLDLGLGLTEVGLEAQILEWASGQL